MNRGNKTVIGLIILLIFTAMASCTKVDRTLGDGFIPEDQKMTIRLDTIYGIQAYVSQVDSFPTTNADSGYIGSFHSPIYGTTSAGFVSQFLWNAFSSKDKFGIAPVIDSVVMTLAIKSAFGDTLKQQIFNIYELEDRIYRDSTYFAFYDAPAKSNKIPLSTFKYSGTQTANIKMTGDQAIAWATRLSKAPDALYNDGADSLFLDQFKGLYIGPDQASPTDASMVAFEIKKSYFVVYAHNFTDQTASKIKDTITVMYSFENQTSGATINTFAHDYTGSQITGINDTLPSSPSVTVGYLQGQGGVTTYTRFTEEFVQSLKSKMTEPYKTMVVNNARMEISMEDPSVDMMNVAPGRVGMYTKYKRFTPIVDYDYSYESQTGTPLPYGGAINRSRGSYIVDISGTMQQILISKDVKSRAITIGPAVGAQYSSKSVMINTTNLPKDQKPLRVILTYTLIK